METIVHKIKYMFEGHSIIKFSYFMNLSFCLWAFLVFFPLVFSIVGVGWFVHALHCVWFLIVMHHCIFLKPPSLEGFLFFGLALCVLLSLSITSISQFVCVLHLIQFAIVAHQCIFLTLHQFKPRGTLNVKFGIYVHQTTIFWEDIR